MTQHELPDQRSVRGEQTRQRLLTAGLSVFGARGYDAVSTRELARAAGVNQAAILYHFGGKEQLYVAVASYVATRGRIALGRLLDAPAPSVTPGRAAAVTRLSAALHAIVHGLLDLTDDGAAAAFVLREQTHPSSGFEPLYAGYIGPVHEYVTSLVAEVTGRAPGATAAIVDAHAVIGMALGFALARATLWRRAGWEAYTPAHVEQIARHVADLAAHALTNGTSEDVSGAGEESRTAGAHATAPTDGATSPATYPGRPL